MRIKFAYLTVLWTGSQMIGQAQINETSVYQSKTYNIFKDRVEQGNFSATAPSSTELNSDYKSPEADKFSPTISFKFSINSRDNEMVSGQDHHVTLRPVNGRCETNVRFGKQLLETAAKEKEEKELPPNTQWVIRLDMRAVLEAFKEKGYYTLFNGEKLFQKDFKGVYVAGSASPLIWDFNNLCRNPELELKDPDGDGIYETTLIMNSKNGIKKTAPQWKLTSDISKFPQYKSPYPISDAIYNMSLEEMTKAVEKDSTFRTGKEWAGVWTRDISYSIILSMAYLQPEVSMKSLLQKVKNDRIIQDTGTGGAYPVSTDRVIWAIAAWEIFKVTGNEDWLKKSYLIIKNTVDDDFKNIYDKKTGLVHGESSFLDWREQTYPRWMQPADIYESENLATNAVYYQVYIVLAQMAWLLNDQPAHSKYSMIAERIKNGINDNFWMKEKGYYGQYLYGRNFKLLSSRAEALGEALCVWFDIAGKKRQKSVIANTPVSDFGITCIYPQIPNIPPYHNNAVWPFVQSFWALASAKAGNEQSVLESFASIYRSTAFFLTNKENFVANTGDFAGTQINSSNMLWSLSGNLALVHKVLFGMEFKPNNLVFHPCVPKALTGNRSLTNFKYRNAVLNIEMEGYGNKIATFKLDGKTMIEPSIPQSLTGMHSIRIILSGNKPDDSKVNKIASYTTVETPVANYSDSDAMLSWAPVAGAKLFSIIKNGHLFQQTTATFLKIRPSNFAEYQVISNDNNGIPSFASEPLIVVDGKFARTYEIEKFAQKSNKGYQNYQGEGFVELSKHINPCVTIPVEVESRGTYAINFRYANGNGPINTDNKCAIRTLTVDSNFSATIVFPQRGTNEWSNWGFSNTVHVWLPKGRHQFTISFEPSNENMNTEINQAMLDAMNIWLIQ